MRLFKIALATGAVGVVMLVFAATGQRQANAQFPEYAAAGQVPQGAGPPLPDRYDWNKDGCSDIIDTYNHHLELWKGSCGGLHWDFNAPTEFAISTDDNDAFLLPGDWDQDGCPDLIARHSTGGILLDLYRGDCDHGFKGNAFMVLIFEPLDFLIAPGSFDSDSCPDLLGRSASTGKLYFYGGNCSNTIDGDKFGIEIGQGWDVFDWIMAPGDLNGDGCPDLAGRRLDNNDLRIYHGSCQPGFTDQDINEDNGVDWSQFDRFISGGRWGYEHGDVGCSDFLGWLQTDAATLKLGYGNCTDGFLGATIDIVSDGWTPAFAGDAAPVTYPHIWGDSDCNGNVVPRDAQALLKYVLQLDPVSQTEPCPTVGQLTTVDGMTRFWGDWDCSGGVLPRDAQAVIKVVLVLPPISQTEPCPDIGDSVLVG